MNPVQSRIPVSTVTVKIKTDDVTIKEESLTYEPYTVSYDDVTLNHLVDSAILKYNGELIDEDIIVTCKFTWNRDVKQKDSN